MSEPRVVYTACACNRSPNVLDWNDNNLIIFGASNAVLVWDPKINHGSGEIVHTLCAHTDRINCIRSFGPYILAGSTDGTASVWKWKDNEYRLDSKIEHSGPVTIVDGLLLNDVLHVFTASADSTIKISKQASGGETIDLVQTITFPSGIVTALCVIFIPKADVILLACATTDSKILLYAKHKLNENFLHVDSLVGHENWVRGLDFVIDDNEDVLLASCSQDTYIRVWKLSEYKEAVEKFEIEPVEHILKVSPKKSFKVTVDTILAGHEGWIYGVHWHPKINGKQPMSLLSASMDKTMIIWSLDHETDLWVDSIRVGEVGGNTLGFYGAKFSPDGQSILGHGYQGSFHMWTKDHNKWEPGFVLGGHFNEVVDLAWEPKGEFLLSVSYDQTTRLHGRWLKNAKEGIWCEIARPQVHGYDMSSVAILSRYLFASGAEEKIIRVFQAPNNFIENFRSICNISDDTEGCEMLSKQQGPKGASVPSLGLSNRAVYDSDIENTVVNSKNEYPDTSYFTPLCLTEPPTEENLMQNTLWPEVQKLYGHGFEIFAMTASSDGKLLASSSKATKLDHAAIILWDASNWQEIQRLLSHSLTITQMAFSPDNNKLLSVSRDRRWSIFERQSNQLFELTACSDKKTGIHSRIIWSCSWSHDSRYFVTGSRDGKVVVWGDSGRDGQTSIGKYEAMSAFLDLPNQSITAVAFGPRLSKNDDYIIALGLETGEIFEYLWKPSNENAWKKKSYLNTSLAHHKTVKRLMFQPISNQKDDLLLASCGSDNIVRIYQMYS